MGARPIAGSNTTMEDTEKLKIAKMEMILLAMASVTLKLAIKAMHDKSISIDELTAEVRKIAKKEAGSFYDIIK